MAKMAGVHHAPSLGFCVDDSCCMEDAYPSCLALGLYRDQNDLLWAQKLEIAAVYQDFDLCLFPTDDVGFSHAGLPQLCDDSSLMDSVEALPCTPGRHRERVAEGNVDDDLDDYG